ncbi:MAG: hypothetical protein COS99_02840 [Candidatus Omnitrophica bacterium CG07_land_8_20_14_0_80_42_15]|uniref:AbiEi antitoxin C-terminal domain-containing protein n=1 Tax=Candidatus Aquitaenariimonas noxiae TaxID=1974741 RepID=A0A2J0KZT9_9BACT|nr:MAG: hypothetical protein COS99_02840 [Candidatus Omnitrophica bacterium CG07_land_8_20_14_0_80_42_15]
MRYQDLLKIKKLYFSALDLASCLGIGFDSAKVTCARYTKAGFIVRIKRNFYILRERWDRLSSEELFSVANILEVPSYISFTTALSYYEISTQVQRDFIESACMRRTKSVSIAVRQFEFFKIKNLYYNSFVKKENFFIATPEKAFIDSLYLTVLGKYKLDTSAVDLDKLNKNKIEKMLKTYPARIRKLMESLWKR